MSHVNEIIVLDDDEDEEEAPRPSKPKASPHNSSKQTNGEEEKSSSSTQQSKADTISAENKTLFNKFVEYCSELTSEHPEVISFLQGRYTKANPSYLTSVEFRNTLGRCLTRVQSKRSKVFVYINELCTALKANSQKRKVSLQTHAVQPSAAVKTETRKEGDGEAEDVPVKKTGSKRQIRYLENLLRIYSLEIKKLQEKELSLEELEDEDSSYIQESRLKRKLLRIFEKLCELKDCTSLTGRVIEQRILYRGTRYPEINRRLEKFINSTRDLFPDYGDVLRVVERANDKHSLSLPRKQMQSMAQDAFRELGNKLQDRRHLDMIYNFGCHLTDPYKSVNDPAQQDTSLSRRLRENRNVAMSRLNDVIKKYAELQDDGEEDFKKKTKRGSERNRQSASEGSEEEEESEDSETDIEEELEHSKEMPDSEEGENEEEEIPADQENEADQKMDMASGEEEDRVKEKDCDDDNDNVMEDQEEATEQESSPVSTSSSQDKDSPNTTMESEVEAQLPDSPDLPSSDSPAKAKSDDEHNEQQEACVPTTNTGDQEEENQENSDLVQSFEDEGLNEVKEAEDKLNCKPHIDIKVSAGKQESTQKCLVLEMTLPVTEKDSDSLDNEQDAEDVADDPSGEESDAGVDPERSVSPVVQEESCTNVSTEEHCERKASVDSMEEETLCTETTGNHDDDDPGDDTAATGDLTPSPSPVVERQDAATKVHTEAADPDSCENKADCDLSPLGSSNGVHMATPMRITSLNRLKLLKDKATRRDSCKPLKIEKESPPPNRKRKNMLSVDWTENNGLRRYNGKDNEEHTEKKRKRAKIDRSYTSLLCSSDSDSDSDEDGETPGLMMTCSPRETPVKKVRTASPAERPRELLIKSRKISNKRAKSHVSTQCDPEEVIVLSD